MIIILKFSLFIVCSTWLCFAKHRLASCSQFQVASSSFCKSVSIFVWTDPFIPVFHLSLCYTFWFNIVLLPPQIFPFLLIVNSWQGLLGELIVLQQQIQQHEEEARKAADQYNMGSSQQKAKVMA